MTLVEEIEKVLNIEVDSYGDATLDVMFEKLSKEGKLTQRVLQDILLILCKREYFREIKDEPEDFPGWSNSTQEVKEDEQTKNTETIQPTKK